MQTKNPMSLEGATLIIQKMRKAFGDKFDKQWQGQSRDEVIATAQEILAGLTVGQVTRGLEKMNKKTFCPSLPEFHAMCLEGMPSEFLDVETAYTNAANEKYTDAATYETARRTGFYELRSRAESTTKPIFKKHYTEVCAQLEINPHAFVLPKAKRIEQAQAVYERKNSAFFENLRKGLA